MTDTLMLLGQKPPHAPTTTGRRVQDGKPAPHVLPEGIQPGSVAADIWPQFASGARHTADHLALLTGREASSIRAALAKLKARGLIDHTPTKMREWFRPDVPAAGLPPPDDDEPMPDPDPVLLASANRMLSDRLAGVAHALRGSGLPALANIDNGEDMQPHVAALTGAYQMAMAEQRSAAAGTLNACQLLAAIREKLGQTHAEEPDTLGAIDCLLAQVAGLQRIRTALEQQVQRLRSLIATRETAGYLIRAPKQPPRIVHGHHRAQNAAIAIARRTGRATVFALQPIGKAVRGAEWVEG